jgi:hypothetical protein
MIETKKPITEKKTKECNFITLHDTSMFSGIKMPSQASNYVLWYKKETPDYWGLTIKRFDDKEEFSSQYIWKLSWLYDSAQDVLAPTKASAEFTEAIMGDAIRKLLDIKDKYTKKKK